MTEHHPDDAYRPDLVEAKWQARWADRRTNEPDLDGAPRPFYNLMMFPYPSAEGLHVGNFFAFTGADVYGRFKRLQGHNVFEPLRKALLEWEEGYATVEYVEKGTNPYTEHYSAVQADVPDESDPSTLPNRRLIEAVKEADTVVIAGEALSHCLANTVRDLAAHAGDEAVKRWILLRDTTSAVPGFEREAESFLDEITRKGIRFTESTELFREARRTGTG